MKVLSDIKDAKAEFIMELLKSFSLAKKYPSLKTEFFDLIQELKQEPGQAGKHS